MSRRTPKRTNPGNIGGKPSIELLTLMARCLKTLTRRPVAQRLDFLCPGQLLHVGGNVLHSIETQLPTARYLARVNERCHMIFPLLLLLRFYNCVSAISMERKRTMALFRVS